jgi:tetratricopeptide (TPR) repeat protein
MPREKFLGDGRYGVLLEEGVSAVCDLYERAWPALDAGDTRTARSLYERALLLEPGSAPAQVGLGSCALQEKDFEGAKSAYRRALELDPRAASAHVGLGSAHYQTKHFAESAEHYEHAVRLDGNLPDAHWGAASAFEALGDRVKMRAHARRFVELAPESALAARARRMLGKGWPLAAVRAWFRRTSR